MRRSHRGYSGYRGRRTSTDVLRIVAVALGALVVLAAAALFYVQNYLVYTDDGVRVDLPFGLFREEDSLPDPGNVSVVERTQGDEASRDAPREPEAEPLAVLEVPLSAVLDGTAGRDSLVNGTARAELEALGADALVVELKDGSGRLAWRSEQPLAELAGVNGDEAVNRALEALEADGVAVIARLTCFRDDAAPYYDTAVALRSGQGNWRDELGLRRMSPASPEARDYLAGLCGELAALGVDEIVLEQAAFPAAGELSLINRDGNYDPDQFAGQMEAFLGQVSEALSPYGAALSLRLEGEELSRPEDSGLTAALAGRFAARVWVRAGALTVGQTALLGGEDKLVSIVDRLEERASGAQAFLLS